MILDEKEHLTFDDVSLVPQYSSVPSRNDVDLSSGRLGQYSRLALPIISANMSSVTNAEMCNAMFLAGGIGFLHRFHRHISFLQEEVDFLAKRNVAFVGSIGVDEDSYREKLDIFWKTNLVRTVCIDVAHGHHQKVTRAIRIIKEEFGMSVIAGNVATASAASLLHIAGADVIKVGVGPGSMCTTRVVTGHGVPQLSAIKSCADALRLTNCKIIADGGIRNAGDIAKALAAGAHFVMLGKLLVPAKESAAEVTRSGNHKIYQGSASYQPKHNEQYVEGVESPVPYHEESAKQILDRLMAGLRSALSYSGAKTLKEFRDRAKFIRITHNSYIEGTPHGA